MPENKIREEIYQRNIKTGTKIIVLDDDPTGCQTVHNIVLTFCWDTDVLKRLIDSNDCFYILTNSRALPGDEAYRLYSGITGNISKTGFPLEKLRIICRSDSTLRGHFMEETTAVKEIFPGFDGLIIAPFFKEGGRITKDDIHYILQDGKMIPVNETEFSRDPSFGYQNAWLPAWIEERSHGYYQKEQVLSISLAEIREKNYSSVLQKLKAATNVQPIIINAVDDSDVDYFCTVLQEAEEQGKRFLYRTGASFVKIRAGIRDKSTYTPSGENKPGLIVAGSYTRKTTDQINYLLDNTNVCPIELLVDKMISLHKSDEYLKEIIEETDRILKSNRSVMIYTERTFITGNDSVRQLLMGNKIACFLSSMVAGLSGNPGFIIAKGGITSHQIAVDGLHIKQAKVLGQVLPGVPVIHTDSTAGIPDIDYVIFPGNVGDEKAVYEVYCKYNGNGM